MPPSNVSIPRWFIRFLSCCLGLFSLIATAAIPFAFSLKSDVTVIKTEFRVRFENIEKTLDRHESALQKMNMKEINGN